MSCNFINEREVEEGRCVWWEKRKDDFAKELILYCWNVSKYRTNQHELGYKDEDVEHLVYDILVSEGIKCKYT